jgi:hypothetical protein
MNTKYLRVRLRSGFFLRAALAIAVVGGVSALPASSLGAPAAGGLGIGWHTVVAGGVLRSRNPCYRLSASIGKPTVSPEITMSANYTLFSGFWTAAPIADQDQIFFDSFEGCKS